MAKKIALSPLKFLGETARLEAILQSVGNGLIVTGQMGKISLVNNAACEMLGWGQEEMVGRIFTEVLQMEVMETPGISEIFDEGSVLNVLATGKKTTNYYIVRKNGTKFPAELTTSSIIYNGAVIGATIAFVDVTRQIESEKAKSDFIAISSHQLRTPLGSMRWNLEMIIDGEYGVIPDKALMGIKEIYESNGRMIELVNNLLDVSRIEQGRIPNNPELTDFAALVVKIGTELEVLANKKSQKLEINNHSVAPKIYIDPKRLREVIENLISNAIKYTPDGGEIKIEVDGDNREVQFSVSDTGIGIPESEQGRLFDRFFRAGNAIRSQTEGSGLGLYVVKAYVESWGGRLWFNSQEGQGSTFYFKLPVVVQ